MSYDNPFVLQPQEYQRDIDPLKHYIEQQSAYLNIMTGKPIETCTQFVKTQLRPGGQFEFKDPRVLYLERGENGDREKKIGTLYSYIMESVHRRELIAPTLTTYLNPKIKKSLLVDFIDNNVKVRGIAKKEKFAAEMAGNIVLMNIKENEQGNKKIANNSISGAHVSPSTPLHNKTGHSTLTSNCRSTSGYGNANNEKFLAGNRHYWSADIVINNIVSVITQVDYSLIESVMAKYHLHAPTAEETLACIKYSTDLYWRNAEGQKRIDDLVNKLTPIQRAAFLYVGDFYHFMKFNDGFTRQFVSELAELIPVVHPNPDGVHKAVLEEHFQLANLICERYTKGLQPKDFSAETKGIVASTAEHIAQTCEKYRDFIRAFWVTPNMPASLAYLPDSIRRVALISDTDSTIFTVQDWVKWHQGDIRFDEKANAVSAVITFLAAQTVIHLLARMSANFGIDEDRIHQIAMKNEFKFDVIVPLMVAKHYYAIISTQEGNIFSKHKKEIKGVHLKNSNAPKTITKAAEDMMMGIMNSVLEGKKISLTAMLKQVADIERSILDDIRNGGYRYFRMAQIKPPDSYSKGESESPYAQYLMWQEVFAPKYGEIQPPPYSAIKISTEIDSVVKTRDWLEQMKDQSLADRMRNWMTKHNKKYVGTIMIPEQAVQSNGIPQEIIEIAGLRQIVRDLCSVFYLLLESLGFYCLNDKTTVLISDHY